MATFSISGRMSVKTVKKNFTDAFGGTLHIMKDGKLADEGATMASLRGEGCKGGELELKGNTKVAGLKKKVAELYGITVEVYDVADKKAVDDGLTLASIATPQADAPTEKPVENKEPKAKSVKSSENEPAPKVAPNPAPSPVQPAAVGFSFNELLEAALADGELTDKERAILLKKATAQGYDPDEVELMIDGRLAKMKQNNPQAQVPQQTKQEPSEAPVIQESKGTLLEKAQKCIKIGETNEAIKIYKRIITDFDADCDFAYKGLFEMYEKKGEYNEALKYGTRYADLNWNRASEIKPVRDLILKMFDEYVASSRKKDAGRFLDNYGQYLDNYSNLCIESLGNEFKEAKQKYNELKTDNDYLIRPDTQKIICELTGQHYNAEKYEAGYAENERISQERKKIYDAYKEDFRKEKNCKSTMTRSLRNKLSDM
jgi:hypothetical protein